MEANTKTALQSLNMALTTSSRAAATINSKDIQDSALIEIESQVDPVRRIE